VRSDRRTRQLTLVRLCSDRSVDVTVLSKTMGGMLMRKSITVLKGCRCRCGHEWLPRVKGEKPRVCPKCKTPNWD
jgi:predicted Zn-ribbon and HTH transcriptional regulator